MKKAFAITVFGAYVSDTAEDALHRKMGRGSGASAVKSAAGAQLFLEDGTLPVVAILR